MILITGATGLLGSHLAFNLLEKNERVRALYRTESSIEKSKSLFALYNKDYLFEKIEWIQCDITDVLGLEMAFKNIEYVYHCAALISFDPKDEDKLRKTNIEGTANIVNFCLDFNVKKLCFVSSIATLGDLKNNETEVCEETLWNPEKNHSDYAISKYGAEMEIWRGQQEGLKVVVVNPGIILGPGFYESGSGKIFKIVKNGLQFYTKGTTGFISVNDVVKVMILLMKSEITGERFICVSQNISFENVLKTIAEILQVKTPNIYAKPWLTGISWRLDWIASLLFCKKRKITRSMAEALHTSSTISNKKTRNALGHDFQNIKEYCDEISSLIKL